MANNNKKMRKFSLLKNLIRWIHAFSFSTTPPHSFQSLCIIAIAVDISVGRSAAAAGVCVCTFLSGFVLYLLFVLVRSFFYVIFSIFIAVPAPLLYVNAFE